MRNDREGDAHGDESERLLALWIPAWSTSSPWTTEAKPFGPNQAATSFSWRVDRVPSSDSSSEAGRISTMARTTAT